VSQETSGPRKIKKFIRTRKRLVGGLIN
jgi:hypothetical protein